MSASTKPGRTLLLYSGGLDSILACEVLRRAGVDVTLMYLECIFFGARTRLPYDPDTPVMHADVSRQMVDLLRAPRFGFGKNMNPCMDCKVMMYRIAWQEAQGIGADFISTGEVVGQRPFTQRTAAFRQMEAAAGLEGLVVRPLCARCLAPTIPERDALVDRERLLALHGRSRKPQMALAKLWGVENYPAPAGGCKLTDPNYAERVAHLREIDMLDLEHLKAVQAGRFFPQGAAAYVLVGRNHEDNLRLLEDCPDGAVMLELRGRPGPLACLVGSANDRSLMEAKRLVVRHSRLSGLGPDEVNVLGREEMRRAWRHPEAEPRRPQ